MSESDRVFEGSCACGGVRYRAEGPLGEVVHCHCTDCRKRHGAAFATHVGVARERFRFVRGEDLIAIYQTSSGTRRSFCRKCGSKLTSDADSWQEIYLAAGTLDTPLDAPTQMHIFVSSRAAWYEITDDHPRHPAYPVAWTEP